jgi:hypothetical protein
LDNLQQPFRESREIVKIPKLNRSKWPKKWPLQREMKVFNLRLIRAVIAPDLVRSQTGDGYQFIIVKDSK